MMEPNSDAETWRQRQGRGVCTHDHGDNKNNKMADAEGVCVGGGFVLLFPVLVQGGFVCTVKTQAQQHVEGLDGLSVCKHTAKIKYSFFQYSVLSLFQVCLLFFLS